MRETRFTHIFVAKPNRRHGEFCRILERSKRFLVIQFNDGTTEACYVSQVRRRVAELEEPAGPRCTVCSDSGVHLSLADGICADCRREAEMMAELEGENLPELDRGKQ